MTNMDFEMEYRDNRPTFEDALSVLKLNKTAPTHRELIYGLSNLTSEQIETLTPEWQKLGDNERLQLIEAFVEISEMNFEFNYDELAFLALEDQNGDVRRAGIELLWESESPEVMDRFILLTQDTSVDVRAEAAKGLGRFILMGELGDISEGIANRAQKRVVEMLKNQEEVVDVRRRALEAISNCGNEVVPYEIRAAYDSHEKSLRISAIFAMGRSCDPQWQPFVLREITNRDPELRYEAVRASGELKIEEAVPELIRMIEEDEREIQGVAIWSLGEIGGKEVLRFLDQLMEEAEAQGDQDLADAIEEAIDNANLPLGDLMFLDLED